MGPVDWETARRSVLRRSRLPLRRSSYPFLSGDTFRGLCGFEFTNNKLRKIGNNARFPNYVFMQVDSIFDFSEMMKLMPFDVMFKSKKYSLVLHNSDTVLRLEDFEDLLCFFEKVYCVNILEESNRVLALPIGLENRNKLRNGVERDYVLRKPCITGFNVERDITFFACFNLLTNPKERKSALDAAQNLPNSKVILNPITPKAYRNYIESSHYVISPPGNGPDCHRTWEALYLDAIPIVKKEFWPFKNLSLPVLQIEDWSSISRSHVDSALFYKSSFRESVASDPIFWLTR